MQKTNSLMETRQFQIVTYPSCQQHTLSISVPSDRLDGTLQTLVGIIPPQLGKAIRNWPWWEEMLTEDDAVIAICKLRDPRLPPDQRRSPLESENYTPPTFGISIKMVKTSAGACEFQLVGSDSPAQTSDANRCLVVCFDVLKRDSLVAVAWFLMEQRGTGKQLASSSTASVQTGPPRLMGNNNILNVMFSHCTQGRGMSNGKMWKPLIVQTGLSQEFIKCYRIGLKGSAQWFEYNEGRRRRRRSTRQAKRKRSDESDVEEEEQAIATGDESSTTSDVHTNLLKSIAVELLKGMMVNQSLHEGELLLFDQALGKMSQITNNRSAATVLSSWQEVLDPDKFVETYFQESLIKSKSLFVQLTHSIHEPPATPTPTLPLFQALIAFALFIYPYQFWSSHELKVASFRLLPPRLKSLILKLSEDDNANAERTIASPTWESLITHIYLHQCVLPIIKSTLKHWNRILEEAQESQQAARLVIRHMDLQPSNMKDFGRIFKQSLGNLSWGSLQYQQRQLVVSANHQTPTSFDDQQLPLQEDQDFFSLYILGQEVLTKMSSSAAGVDNSGGSDDRQKAVFRELHQQNLQVRYGRKSLTAISSFLPGVLLEKPSPLVNPSSSNNNARNGGKNTQGPLANRMVPRHVKALHNDIDVMDIEDLLTEQAPACIRSIIHRYSDITMPFPFSDRMVLHNGLIMAISQLVEPKGQITQLMHAFGSTPVNNATASNGGGGGGFDGSKKVKERSIENSNDRSTIIELVMEWYKRANPMRYEYIKNAQKYGEHDFGPNIKGMIKSFLESGEIFSRKCACIPSTGNDSNKPLTAQTQRYTPPYECPHLTAVARENDANPHESASVVNERISFTPTELGQAVSRCRREMEIYAAGISGTEVMRHPPKMWAERARRTFHLKRKVRLDAIRSVNTEETAITTTTTTTSKTSPTTPSSS